MICTAKFHGTKQNFNRLIIRSTIILVYTPSSRIASRILGRVFLEKKMRLTPSKMPQWPKDMAPALAVLIVTMLFSFVSTDSAPLSIVQAVRKVPLRFARFTLFLSIPLLALPRLYSFIVKKKSAGLLRVEQEGRLEIRPIKHWLSRPFQGIGIGLLFGTKLLGVLQLIAGPAAGSSLLLPEGHFQFGRLLLTTLITVLISLLLSTLWTLDDLGIRYFNRRDHELKMIGKYAGVLMPVVFGFYGIVNLLGHYPAWEAFLLSSKIAVVLYPPAAVFAVLHTYFVRSRIRLFSDSGLARGGIREEG